MLPRRFRALICSKVVVHCRWRVEAPRGSAARTLGGRSAILYPARVDAEFELISEIREVETIATGHGIRILDRLNRAFGKGNWRKLKGFAAVRLPDGTVSEAEIHWFEAHGIGKRRMKIKRLINHV